MIERLPFPMIGLAMIVGTCPLTSDAGNEESSLAPAAVRVPFEFRNGDLIVHPRVNGSAPLSFKLDTGFSVTTIHPDLVESLQLKRAGRLTIQGIAGDEEASTFEGAVFDFDGTTYSPRRVAVLPSDARKRRRNRDGILGGGFFQRFVVEIDPTNRLVWLHEPKHYEYKGAGEIIPLEIRNQVPIVEASINFTNRPPVQGRFDLDTGCDDYLCLGHDFVEKNHLADEPDSAAESVRQGVGGSARIRPGRLPQLQLGKVTIDHPSANFFLQGSPTDSDLAGHIGLAALRRFKVIFDYSRRRMILEPASGMAKDLR